MRHQRPEPPRNGERINKRHADHEAQATVGEILTEEFMRPLGLTQGALAEAMGVPRKHANELCNDRRSVTAPTALILILVRVFG